MSQTLEDFKTYDLIEELEMRGYVVRDVDDVTHGLGDSLIDKIYHLRRQCKPFDRELDQYLYEMTGRAV
jgi:hypothetical protein